MNRKQTNIKHTGRLDETDEQATDKQKTHWKA
jgi:hypothetical protein